MAPRSARSPSWTALTWVALAAALLACSRASAAGAGVPVELQLRPEAMAELMKRPEERQLPRFWVFDRSGAAVHYELGLRSDFPAALGEALAAAPQPLAGEPGLAQRAQSWQRAADGAPLELESLRGADYVFVEYWAGWCAPCRMQMRALQEFLAARPELRVAWIQVEVDPHKGEEPPDGKARASGRAH